MRRNKMAMSLALPKQGDGLSGEIIWRYIKVPAFGILRYGPSVLLALPSAFASAQFAMHHTIFPELLAWMIGIAFEWMYLGTLAMSSALRGSAWFKRVNYLAVCTAILYVTLYAAGKYGALDGMESAALGGVKIGGALLWAFSIIHAAPLAGLNYMYNNLIHEYHQEQRATQEAAEEADAARVQCPYCDEWKRNQAAVYSHYRTCPKHPKNAGGS
jgi:hypothetical protein